MQRSVDLSHLHSLNETTTAAVAVQHPHTLSNMSSTFSLKQLSKTKAFECDILRFEHTSPTLGKLRTIFSAIVPAVPNLSPVIYWLSGLTCTDENFIIKAGAAQYAARNGVIIVCPDTSPRGANAPGENDGWDFGTGAGFYVDATTEDFRTHYRMASYVVDELPSVVAEALSGRVITDVRSIFGHSMGGMGALSLALRNEGSFVSVSAFAPIANPVNCPWGERCYTGYLGADKAEWKKYDPTELMNARERPLFDAEILIDQGDEDSFLETQLHPSAFVEACKSVGQQVR